MRRKMILLLAALSLLAIMALPAFAETATDAKTWFEQRFEAKKAAVDQAVQDGRMTSQQGQELKDHFDQMYRFHEANGFTCPMGGRFSNGNGEYRGGQGMGFGRMMWQNNGQS